jgi:hypothetical protein
MKNPPMVEVKIFKNIFKVQNSSTIKNYLLSAMVKADCFLTRLKGANGFRLKLS